MKPQTLVSQHLTEIAIFDSRLDDLSTLLTGLNPGVEPLVLHSEEDALVQIAAVLANRQNIRALHLIGHGAPGMIFLGRSPITLNHLTATQLQPWKDALAPNASILIYGCNVAEGKRGAAFMTRLQYLTQAHVAASTTPIGNAAHGGNWELDATPSPHAVRLAIQPAARAAYSGILMALDDLSADLFTLNGSAVIENEGGTNIIRLTPDETSQSGTALSNSKIDLTTDWTLTVELAFGSNDGGADGIAFILHNDPAGAFIVGRDGGELGVGGIQNSLAIEFDTLGNQDLNDPGFDHTTILDPEQYGTANPTTITVPTQLGVDANNNPLNIETGQYFVVSISWNAATNTLAYSFDGNEFAPLIRDLVATDFNGATEVFWGFGGGTGAATNPQSVRFLAGDDRLIRTDERDVIVAGAGNDTVVGLGGNADGETAVVKSVM